MPIFSYKGYDSAGAEIDGQIEALSLDTAKSELSRNKKIYLSEITEVNEEGISTLFSSNKVNLADIEFLTSELSLLLSSGVRIDKGIDIIRKTKAKPALAALLKDMSAGLKRGNSLSDVASKYPDVFDKLYVNLIELGEASGELSQIFQGLSKDLKFKRELSRKIIQALTYPSVVLFVCLACVVFIFNFIVPKMSTLFSGMKNLPWYTELMMGISAWFQDYQLFLAMGLLTLIGVVKVYWKNEHFQLKLQSVSLRLPLVKSISITAERIRFNSGLSLMLAAGVQIDRALELATGSLKNIVIKRELDIARKKVKRGSQLAPALKQTSIYPDFYVSLLEVGEESGNLVAIFDEIAERSRQDFEDWTQKLTTLIEPLLILIMGGIVGGVVVVMLLSMVSVNDIGL